MRKHLKLLLLLSLLAFSLLFGGCASWGRELKSFTSDIGGGLDRTVTLYDYNGEVIRQWTGKFDIASDDIEVYFDDQDGRRVIIQGGIVVAEEN